MTDKPYPDVQVGPHFPELEQTILDQWKRFSTFEQSVQNRPTKTDNGKNNEFIFYDGPPFANGLPHYGHLLTGFCKDLYARYQTMLGKRVERRFGWDCHGLPAEMGAEKELGISGRVAIMGYGVDRFNEHCRTSVMKFADEWEYYVTRQARWVDFKGDYKTMDTSFMESVLWAFKQLYDKGLVYQSVRVMPYSWACETPLSNFETRLDNAYRKKESKSITVALTLEPKEGDPGIVKALVWTTTPWTLPSNLALAVGPDIDYVMVKKDETYYVLAADVLAKHSREFPEESTELVGHIKGSELVGRTYAPLFPYFSNHPNAFQVLSADFVVTDEGTGIVHMAPGFGEDDFNLCQEKGIDVVCPVDSAGKFTSQVPDYQGKQVFETNDSIIIYLKETGAWIKTEQYIHNYPHCWRTDTPLIYKAVPSWYVKVTAFKDRMVELNQQINWMPSHVKGGLFGKWLENARDWSISRNRFFGTPIPVWKSDDEAYPRIDVYGSIEALEKDFGVKVTDLHSHHLNALTRPNPDDPTGTSMMRRVDDVFDCWFESGSMPYGQAHYPFENKDWFENHFPADFIVEYTAQTRGWFYTLMVLSTALFDRPPFLNCICHGVILDASGEKLSKRLKNYADPKEMFETYGADAMRWLMLNSPVMRGQELLIDQDGQMIKDVVRLTLKPIWNAYHFFTLYANSDGVKAKFRIDSSNLMDRYILAKAKLMVQKVQQALDQYDTPGAPLAVQQFIEVLNNWYIRRNRDRFWRKMEAGDTDKEAAYDTLYTALHLLCRVSAPLLPLMSEAIFLGLTNNGVMSEKHSVHFENFPDVEAIADETVLVKEMDRVQAVCNAGLAVRHRKQIRTRQPLAKLEVIGKDVEYLARYEDLIMDELNVKALFVSADLEAQASYVLQLNFKSLGARLGQEMKVVTKAAKQGDWKLLGNDQLAIAGHTLNQDEFTLLLKPVNEDEAESLSTHDALVILDTALTEALEYEGVARDMIRLVQQARKKADLYIGDRIELAIHSEHPQGQGALAMFHDYVCEQTLATTIVETLKDPSFSYNEVLDEVPVRIELKVAA